jgi:glutamyl-tRNA reductase
MSPLPESLARFGVVGFNHRRLPGRLRGRLAFEPEWCNELANRLRESGLADGVAFVATCNRQEIVLSADHPAFALELIRAQLHSRLAGAGEAPLPEPYRHVGAEAVRHVLRVSASLDSLVVGERQITGQLGRSFDAARRQGWLDKPLNGLARIAVETAKEVHGRTSIGARLRGVFTLAFESVHAETRDLARPRVAVVGLGEIGLRCARSFAGARRFDLVLSSRRPRSAAELGTTLETHPFTPFSQLDALLRESDAIVFATAAVGPVLDRERLERARGADRRPLVVVDLGIPPQVEPDVDTLDGVVLRNLDWFTQSGFGQVPEDRVALAAAEHIVDEGVRRLAAWTSVRKFSALFDSCVLLTDRFKAQVIPEAIREELAALTPEQQRAVFTTMHRVLTEYSEGVFENLSRALQPTDTTSESGSTDGPTPAGDRQSRQ